MSGQDVIALVVVVILFGTWLLLYLMGRRKKPKKQPPTDSTLGPSEQSAPVPVMESPKVAAMRGATRQSLLLNMAAIQSFQQMSKVAQTCQIDTTTRRYPQSEWLDEYNNSY